MRAFLYFTVLLLIIFSCLNCSESKYKTYLPFELIYNLLPEYRNLKSYVNSSSKKGLMDIKNWKIKFHKNNMLLTKKIIILNPWTAIFVLKKDKNYS